MATTEKRPVIEVTGLKKQYKLGQIGGGTLTHDLQSWWARVRGKEDPNTVIGTDQRLFGQTFMALNGIDLTVYQGEALGIIGRNGAGKSTLLKLLSRITAPTEGEIKIRGRVASMLESSPRLKVLVQLNPMTSPIEIFRMATLGTGTVTTFGIVYSLVFTAAALVLGVVLFSRIEKTFMDTV